MVFEERTDDDQPPIEQNFASGHFFFKQEVDSVELCSNQEDGRTCSFNKRSQFAYLIDQTMCK